MIKRLRSLGAVPIFPSVLAAGALLMGLPWLKIILLGLLAVGMTGLCALFLSPKEEEPLPAGWNREMRNIKRALKKIKNLTVYRRGHEILTDLTQCQTALPFLSSGAQREIAEYYLPTFSKYFAAYATFEECNEGNATILTTMEQMEGALGEIADRFREVCDRNDRTTALNIHAETSLLTKKLNVGGSDHEPRSSEIQ